MTADPTAIAALVGAGSSVVGAIVFALRSRVQLAEVRETRRIAAEIASDEARTRTESECRAERDAWRVRAEVAETRERQLSDEVADLRAEIELEHALSAGRGRRQR